jgi:hypothetical protein
MCASLRSLSASSFSNFIRCSSLYRAISFFACLWTQYQNKYGPRKINTTPKRIPMIINVVRNNVECGNQTQLIIMSNIPAGEKSKNLHLSLLASSIIFSGFTLSPITKSIIKLSI